MGPKRNKRNNKDKQNKSVGLRKQQNNQKADQLKISKKEQNEEEINSQDNSQKDQQKQLNSEQQKQLLQQCPYRKQAAFKLFKIKGQTKIYNFKQVQLQMKQSLIEMEDYGYDFRLRWWRFRDIDKGEKRYYKKFNRKIYLRFQCPKCIQKHGQKKRWTSILGNLQMRFQVNKLQDFWKKYPQYVQKYTRLKDIKYPYIIKWMLKIYNEYCQKCRRSGRPFVYQSQLKACQIQFCRVIYQIINKVRPKENVGNRIKNVQVHHHKEQLCEACQKNQCFNIPNEQIIQLRHEEH